MDWQYIVTGEKVYLARLNSCLKALKYWGETYHVRCVEGGCDLAEEKKTEGVSMTYMKGCLLVKQGLIEYDRGAQILDVLKIWVIMSLKKYFLFELLYYGNLNKFLYFPWDQNEVAIFFFSLKMLS